MEGYGKKEHSLETSYGTRQEHSNINNTITAPQSQDNKLPNLQCFQGFFPLPRTTTMVTPATVQGSKFQTRRYQSN